MRPFVYWILKTASVLMLVLLLGFPGLTLGTSHEASTSDASSGGTGAFPDIKGPVLTNDLESVPKIVKRGFTVLIVVSSIVFVVLLLIGGVMYLTSFGNDEQSKRAKTLLLDAVIGLAIVVTAWAVGNFVIRNLLGIQITGIGG